MRALSFLFAALLGIALAMIAPALAGPGTATAPTVIAAEAAAPLDLPAELSEAAAPAGQADEMEASLMVELGLDALQLGDAA
ncbi:MAG: hypothetical protein ACKO6F_01855 [Cyanobium sp.]